MGKLKKGKNIKSIFREIIIQLLNSKGHEIDKIVFWR